MNGDAALERALALVREGERRSGRSDVFAYFEEIGNVLAAEGVASIYAEEEGGGKGVRLRDVWSGRTFVLYPDGSGYAVGSALREFLHEIAGR